MPASRDRRLWCFLLIVSAVVFAAAPRRAHATLSFNTNYRFNTGAQTNSVALADLNGDGKPDIVTANMGADSVSVLFGDGDGRFHGRTDYAVGDTPLQATLADLNVDGFMDIVTADSGSNTVTVLLGDGGGGFGAGISYPTGPDPWWVSVADVDRDGRPDLAVAFVGDPATGDGDGISILLGIGGGAFGSNTDYPAGFDPIGVVVADFNNDGKPDLAAANIQNHNVSILMGDGAGGFGVQRLFHVGYYPSAIATADFNRDGNADLAVTSKGPFPPPLNLVVSVLLGHGDGTFGTATEFPTNGNDPQAIAIGDVDLDGNLDLALACSASHSIAVMLGHGDGTFDPGLNFYNGGSAPTSVQIRELNGDGMPDLILTNQVNHAASILLNTTPRDLAPPVITCPSDIALHCVPSSGAPAVFSVTATDDKDPAPVITCSPASGSVFPVGATLVHCTATDNAGNSASCAFTVTLSIDAQAPSIAAPPPIQAIATAGPAGCVAIIDDASLGTATASDDCPGAVTIARSGVPAGNAFPLGTTTISWTATDAAGNTASASQEVHVTGAPGAVAGRVTASCPAPNTRLLGVQVDVFDSAGDHIGTAVTDVAGAYAIHGLEAGEPLTVTVVTPLGYQAANEDVSAAIECGETIAVDFALSCVQITANPRTQGFWKHQVGVATGGPGAAQVDGPTLCAYLDLIEAHFNSNAINQVLLYQPPSSGLCADKLRVAKELLDLKGSASMTARARQQLMALLLNVAAGYIGQQQVVSADGATVSQAITYCDHLIDGPASGHETAKTIADTINNGQTVPAGRIPLNTEQISYDLGSLVLDQNQPNPFRKTTTIGFSTPVATSFILSVFDASGRLVRHSDGAKAAGTHRIVWDGRDDSGSPVAPGVYFYKITAGMFSSTKRMVVLK